jgi:penicillin-binding protein 1B
LPGLPKLKRPLRTARQHRKGPPSGKRPRRLRYLLLGAVSIVLCGFVVAGYIYVSYTRMIDERLHGERERTVPRVYARPIEIHRGQSLSQPDLVARLNDLGYAQRPQPAHPGEFSVLGTAVAIVPRTGPYGGKVVRVTFPAPSPGRSSTVAPSGVRDMEVVGSGKLDDVLLDAPLLTVLMTTGAREKRRHVPLERIPVHVQQAVLAIEDQSFYAHPGINPFRVVTAALSNLFGARRAPIGNSTITQQLSRMFFQADEFNAELQSGERSYARYIQGVLMSILLERRASKREILELYLNDVYLGQRGSFAIHGIPEASHLFFGKDVANISISEAALIAGVIHSPASRSPFTNAKRSMERRNVVIGAMAGEAFITQSQADRASREPLQVTARAIDNEAPYFVDMVGRQVAKDFPGLTARPGTLNVYTTLDLNVQRAALDAVRRGLARVDEMLARRKRKEQPQAALIAVDPRTGEILAMVGGRSYNQSQFNRALDARRQPGSVFKPFVFLAAFERAAAEHRTDFTPASLTSDEPGVLEVDGRSWEPKNYDDYDGDITWRRALAMSRNLGTIHVGERVGFDRVAALWKRVGVGTPPQAYPSIALGVFELTPLEVAQAYTLFLNGGSVRPLKSIDRILSGERTLAPQRPPIRRVARADTTFLVTNMMRSVLNEGTGAGARAAGFARDAAGKSGTTNDLRDAWFVGFTPELLTVVWVGYDNNRPLSLTGTQAALPIWTEFMKKALAGHSNATLEAPEGVTFVEIDRDTGLLAAPACPRTITESFLAGTEPTAHCELHGH